MARRGAGTDRRRLQWGSETGSRRRCEVSQVGAKGLHASMGLRDWVSEKASMPCTTASIVSGALQWGSETGSRRRSELTSLHPRSQHASMGLRDWVSEKVAAVTAMAFYAKVLQWGSETGSRRR